MNETKALLVKVPNNLLGRSVKLSIIDEDSGRMLHTLRYVSIGDRDTGLVYELLYRVIALDVLNSCRDIAYGVRSLLDRINTGTYVDTLYIPDKYIYDTLIALGVVNSDYEVDIYGHVNSYHELKSLVIYMLNSILSSDSEGLLEGILELIETLHGVLPNISDMVVRDIVLVSSNRLAIYCSIGENRQIGGRSNGPRIIHTGY